MGCTYEFMGRKYSKEQLIELLKDEGIQNKIKLTINSQIDSNNSYSLYEDIGGELFDEDFNASSDISPEMLEQLDSYNEPLTNYKAIVQFKKNLIKDYKNRIANIKGAINRATNKNDIKRLTKLQEELQSVMETMEAEVKRIENSSEVSMDALKYQAARDLERVQRLLSPSENFIDNFENAEEARKIINFYKALRFSAKNNDVANSQQDLRHPFFNIKEIYDNEGNIALPAELVNIFDNLAATFEKEEGKYTTAQRNLIEKIVNANPRIMELYNKQLTYNEITSPLTDLDGVAWVDMMIMDITKGIFSKNGLIPQIAMTIIQDNMAEQIGEHKRFEEKTNKLLPKVEKALKTLGQTIGAGNVSFDMFFQKALGRNTGKLVNRYSQNYFDEMSAVMNEYKEDRIKARATEDKETRDRLFEKATNKKDAWFKENTMMFDVRKLPEVVALFPEFELMFEDDGGKHKAELIEEIGETGYYEQLEKQIQEIKKFVAWKNSATEIHLEQQNVSSVSELSTEELENLQRTIASHNPFVNAQYFYEGKDYKVGNKKVFHQMNYTITIPRKNKLSNGESTGFYDKNYEIIEKNKDLKEYYDLIKGRMETIVEQFPEEVRQELFVNSLPLVRKSVAEILADPNVSFLQRISNVFKEIYEQIVGGFGINVQDNITYDNDIDPITGNVESRVNTQFLNNNKQRIRDIYNIEAKKMGNILGKAGFSKTINKFTTYPVNQLPSEAIRLLAEKLKVAPNVRAIENKVGVNVRLGDVLYKATLSDVVEQHSLNLPKVIKYYSLMAAEYNARQQSLPLINTLKTHYTQIKRLRTNNIGKPMVSIDDEDNVVTDGTRYRANTQFESWFNRVVLGNYGVKGFGVVASSNEKKKELADRMKATMAGRILTRAEKKQRDDLNKLIDEETDAVEKQKLITQREKLGKQVSASAAIDNLLNYVRFLGLGYNLSSSVTNFMEGQMANMMLAATGDYFDSKHYYRAMHVTGQSFVKNTSFGLIKRPGAVKARFFIDKFDILQDSSNELQKASIKSPLNRLQKASPYELNARVEYLNQAPIMVAVMLDTEITGVNGQKGNVWDALNPDGTLKKEFATEENIQTWEVGTGQQFRDFKRKVNNAIVMAHGNYDQLRGMMAKEGVIPKALMMFKSWVGSVFYQRFAIEQDDIETGVRGFKGRYRSFTKSSGAMFGALAGFAVAGPAGIFLGGGFGAAMGLYSGNNSDVEIKGNLGMLNEMAFLLNALVRKSIGFPINMLAGKEVIAEADFSKLTTNLQNNTFTERDAKNAKALITEMSIMLSYLALMMATKAMLWDDDDEDDDPKRIQHNIIMNRLNQLMNSATSYVMPQETWKNLVSTTPLFTFTTNVWKTTSDISEWLEGNDIGTDGQNAGASKLAKSASKIILPSVARDSYLGFGTQAERQFTKTNFDDWFWDDEKLEKRVLQGKRARLQNQLENEGLDPEDAKKVVNKRLPLPKDIKDPGSRTATKSIKKEKKIPLSAEEKRRIKKMADEEIERIKQEMEDKEEK
jgi:hypothetical protein